MVDQSLLLRRLESIQQLMETNMVERSEQRNSLSVSITLVAVVEQYL